MDSNFAAALLRFSGCLWLLRGVLVERDIRDCERVHPVRESPPRRNLTVRVALRPEYDGEAE